MITPPLRRSGSNPLVGSPGKARQCVRVEADAAISRSRQLSKADSQATFFCFTWSCRTRTRTSATWTGSTLRTTWHLPRPKNMLWHGDCTIYANMLITVTAGGSVRSSLSRCD